MDIVFEFLVELIIDGCIEAVKNKKVPSVIRYPLIALILITFLSVIIVLIILGIKVAGNQMFAGILLVCSGVLILIWLICKFRKTL